MKKSILYLLSFFFIFTLSSIPDDESLQYPKIPVLVQTHVRLDLKTS